MLHYTLFIYVTYLNIVIPQQIERTIDLSKKTDIIEKSIGKTLGLIQKVRINTWCWINLKNVRAQPNELKFLASQTTFLSTT